MKRIVLSMLVLTVLAFTACKQEPKKEAGLPDNSETGKNLAMTEVSFGVRGNCGMCKNTIESAAKAVNGVSKAVWDVNKKKIDVSFNGAQTDLMAIHNAIAASGYDTEKVLGSEEAYKNLPGCCQYDHQMQMNQSGESTSQDHSDHNH
ncbi:heavy-metal-associated domain-containing protein [Sediminicola luteus]|uniref:Heavy metal transporter n=1 Tax=Sediminicola luteus TaxID=319238 RepID=A0A2A4G8Q0_9FLAO|nr:cation transporter [Sediminicola luteus]PCE64358.1 heavy metal transporter [Sediminicola luteus]